MIDRIKKPVLSVIIIYLFCFLFRVIEYFLIRTDKTFLGEALLHKIVGIVILYGAVKLFSFKWDQLGFSKKDIYKNIMRGLVFGVSLFIVAYSVEIFILIFQGKFQSIQWYVSSYAVDRNIGNQTSIIFFIICIVGNVINVIMEEGLFRGLFPSILEKKYTFIRSIIIASILFGLWHVIAPIRSYYDGFSSLGGMMANIIMLVVTSGLAGFQFALLTKLTGSLYMAMTYHFINNTIVNMLHVSSTTGIDELMFLRISIAQTVSFVLVLWYFIYKQQKSKDLSTQNNLSYEPIKEADEMDLMPIWGDVEVIRYTSIKTPCTKEEINQRIQRLKDFDVFGVYENEEMIGVIGCPCIDKDLGQYGIFYQFKKSSWGKGYASEATAWLLDYMNKKYAGLTIHADVVSNNIASEKILKHFNFKYIGKDEKGFERDGMMLTVNQYELKL